MSTKTIYDALVAAGMTREGASSVVGNWLAESGCEAYRLEGDFSPSRGKSHAYVSDVMSGVISRQQFSQDRKGYGLAQWTYPTRKAALYDFLQARGVPLDDEASQVQFALQEMRTSLEYASVWAVVTSSHDLFQCTQIVCKDYEKPAVNNVGTRHEYAQQFLDELANGSVTPTPVQQPEPGQSGDRWIGLLQFIMSVDGYWGAAVDGIKSQEFRDAIKRYAADVAAS